MQTNMAPWEMGLDEKTKKLYMEMKNNDTKG
jgi:hypothetical protein